MKSGSHLLTQVVVVAVVAVCLVGGSYSSAQENQLTIHAGVTQYNNPEFDTLILVEFPFSLKRHEFEFFKPDSGAPVYEAKVFAQIDLLDPNEQVIDSSRTYFSVRVGDLKEAVLKDYRLFDNLVLLVSPGEYSARLTVIDVTSKKEGLAVYDRIVVAPTADDKLILGGGALAYSVTYVGDDEKANPRLVKNGLLVYGNPIGVFSIHDDHMYFYGELYNIGFDPAAPTSCKFSFRIENKFGGVYRDFGYMLKEKVGETMVIAERFDISDFEIGQYEFRVIAEDQGSGQTVEQTLPLLVVSPANIERAVLARAIPDDPYDTLDVTTRVNLVKYELTAEEKATLDRLSDVGKNNYLDRYWDEHDPEPLTAVNERRLELIEAYETALQVYSSSLSRTDGWRTDRGRVMMKYGKPDRVKEYLMPLVSVDESRSLEFVDPYEIWWYFNIEGGKVFVFEDQEGSADYTLVHSDADGEIYSAAWNNALRDNIIEME